MKAVLLTAAGGVEQLQLQDVPMPQLPSAAHIRVRLHAAGINPVDYKMRNRGGLDAQQLPIILGCDGAGVVESVGAQVTRFKVGDAVYFYNGGIGAGVAGNYAEYTCIHQEYAAAKPASLSFQEAAALPLAWITAAEAFIDRVNLSRGQKVLIHAGSGGVGHLAIQLAKKRGARVATTVSSEAKAQFAHQLGADLCIDYSQTDFTQAVLGWTQQKGVDVVFDTVGGETFCHSMAACKVYGKLVTLLEYPCDSQTWKSAKLRNLSISYEMMLTPEIFKLHEARIAQREMLEQASAWIDAGELRVHIARILPLEEVATAHQLIEAGHTTGKIVLDIAGAGNG